MEKSINSFHGGLDQDTSINKYGKDVYFDAVDMRIISRGSLSKGAMVNVPGNKGVIGFNDKSIEIIQDTTIGDNLYIFGISPDADQFIRISARSFGQTLTITRNDVTYKWLIVDSIEDVPVGYEGLIYESDSISTVTGYFNSTTLSVYFTITYSGTDITFEPLGDSSLPDFILTISNTAGFDLSGRISSYIFELEDYSLIVDDVIPTNTVELYDDTFNINKLNFHQNYLSVVGNEEVVDLKKLYWANGIDPLRMMIIGESYSPIDASEFDHIPNITFGDMELSVLNGGGLTSGVIQYSYQYFNKNGYSSTFAPVSELIKLAEKKDVGSEVGDLISKSVGISLTNLDSDYSNIRVVALYYPQYGVAPEVNIVSEVQYSSNNVFVIDSGSYIGSVTLDDFRATSQTTLSPKYIESKDNLLFAANINEITFDSDTIDNWDSRAYGFTGYQGSSIIYDNPINGVNDTDYYTLGYSGAWTYNLGGSGSDWRIPENYSGVNRSNSIYDTCGTKPTYVYNPTFYSGSGNKVSDSTGVFGGDGKNINYWFEWFEKDVTYGTDIYERNPYNDKDLKYKDVNTSSITLNLTECQKNEIYRIGIKFFNNKGQTSFVKWIADVRWPDLVAKTTPISSADAQDAIVIKIEVNNFPDDDSITGYQIVRAERTPEDRSILSTGVISALDFVGDDYQAELELLSLQGYATWEKKYFEFISPETLFNGPDLSTYTGKKMLINGIAQYSSGTVAGSTSNSESQISIFPSNDPYSDTDFTTGSSTMCYGIDRAIDVSNSLVTETVYPRVYQLSSTDTFTNKIGYGSRIGARFSGVILALDTDMSITYATGTYKRLLLTQIVNDVDISRYGGYSYNGRNNTVYIGFSDYIPIAINSTFCTMGDTYNNITYAVRSYFHRYSDTVFGVQQLFQMTSQSIIDTRYRSDDILNNYAKVTSFTSNTDLDNSMFIQETTVNGITLYPESYDETIGDLYRYNNVYSQEGTANIGFEKPLNWTEYSVNPHKVSSSNKKTNGETNDSWLNFLTSNYIEVNSEYGEITNVILFKNKLLFFQPDAFGTLSVNDRSLINDNNVGSISLGTGGVLSRYDYVSYYSGATLPTDIIKAKNNVFYIDFKAKQIMSIEDPSKSVSELSGVDSILNDLIIDGNSRVLGYDNQYGEVLYSIGDTTLVYNEITKSFVSKYLITPNIYVNTPNILFSQKYDLDENISTRLYRHNIGEKGLWYKDIQSNLRSVSSVTMIINPNGNAVNKFDNIDLRTEVFQEGQDYPEYKDLVTETVSRLKFSNSYIHEISIEAAVGGSTVDPQTAGLKRLARQWRAQVPLANGNRFVDTHMILKLEYDNNKNKLFKLHDVITIYRTSNQ